MQIGVDPGTLTLIHHAEHLADIPSKRRFRYPAPLMQNGERVWVTIEEYDTSQGIIDWPGDYLRDIATAFRADGYGNAGKVGAAESYICRATDLRDFAVQWLETPVS